MKERKVNPLTLERCEREGRLAKAHGDKECSCEYCGPKGQAWVSGFRNEEPNKFEELH